MIEKILDKYYAKKLEAKIKNSLSLYCIDKSFIYSKSIISLYVKNKKWKDDCYTLIMAIPYEECFELLIDNKRYISLIKDIEYFINKELN
jgi:hypothetical protein